MLGENIKALRKARERIDRERNEVQADAAEQMPQLVSALARQLLSGGADREER